MTDPARPLVLCADDYGLNPGVSRGIRDLAARGRISATSCMANAPGWEQEAAALRELDGGAVGIGLHLTLTEGAPLGPMPSLAPSGALPPLGRLMTRAARGRLPRPEIEGEIERQLARFSDSFGRPPDFVDGHQHVHVLPGIRGPLLAVLARAGLAGRTWLRDPSERSAAILRRKVSAPKALFVGALATGFGRGAQAAGFATNHGFSGFSPFHPTADPSSVFEAALEGLGPRPLAMCHPGRPDPGPDPIARSREAEWRFLGSDAFAALLEARRIELRPRP